MIWGWMQLPWPCSKSPLLSLFSLHPIHHLIAVELSSSSCPIAMIRLKTSNPALKHTPPSRINSTPPWHCQACSGRRNSKIQPPLVLLNNHHQSNRTQRSSTPPKPLSHPMPVRLPSHLPAMTVPSQHTTMPTLRKGGRPLPSTSLST